VVGFTLRPLYFQRRAPVIHYRGGWVSPTVGLEVEKISQLCFYFMDFVPKMNKKLHVKKGEELMECD
jgi:hypothetical protein